jgi:hypothetical protein
MVDDSTQLVRFFFNFKKKCFGYLGIRCLLFLFPLMFVSLRFHGDAFIRV